MKKKALIIASAVGLGALGSVAAANDHKQPADIDVTSLPTQSHTQVRQATSDQAPLPATETPPTPQPGPVGEPGPNPAPNPVPDPGPVTVTSATIRVASNGIRYCDLVYSDGSVATKYVGTSSTTTITPASQTVCNTFVGLAKT